MLLLRITLLAIALCFSVPTRAHTCGARTLNIPLGSVAIWNIDADFEEVQTLYTPISIGDTNIAVIWPNRQFLAHDAYFAIHAKKVGTTTISYQWYYAGTQFGGTCTVTVNVTPAIPFGIMTSYPAGSFLPLYAFSQYLRSHEYIFTPTTLPPGAQYNSQTGEFFWIPNALGFYIMTGLWALPSAPNDTFPLLSHFLVSPRSALRLDIDTKYSKPQLCIGNPMGGPITLERSENLRDWSSVATYSSTPDREIRAPLSAANTSMYRTRLGAPALQLGAEPEYFQYPIPKDFAVDSRLFWSVAANDDAPGAFEGPLTTYNGRFVMPLDPQTLPSRGNIYFTIQDALRSTAVYSQPFEKITGASIDTAPTVTGLADTITIPRNGQPLSWRFMATDDRTYPSLIEVHPISMNPVLVPEFRIAAEIDADGSGTLQISANPNQTGSTPVHLRFFDGHLTATKIINVQIAANTAPNIGRLPSLYTPINTPTRVVDFTVSDAETLATSITLSATSSDQTIIPNKGITIGGSGNNRSIYATPSAGATGSSTITVTVTDAEGLTDQSDFEVTVVPAPRNYYDFNLDMRTDLIFQDDTGSLAAWYMNGSTRISEAPFNPSTTGTKDWQLIGAGYFDRDRLGDVLYQYTDGTLATWHLDSLSLKYGSFLSPQKSDLGYTAVAVTDLDRDRESDIVFQNADGQISAWLMNGAERRSTLTFSAQPDNTWRLMGAGDFNFDAYPDFVLQKDDGSLAVWYMKIAERLGTATFTPSQPDDPQERVAAVTDLNNDYKIDLLFQKPTGGPVRAWHMNGLNRISPELLNPQPTAFWRLVGP
jgi:hypothetical protein